MNKILTRAGELRARVLEEFGVSKRRLHVAHYTEKRKNGCKRVKFTSIEDTAANRIRLQKFLDANGYSDVRILNRATMHMYRTLVLAVLVPNSAPDSK